MRFMGKRQGKCVYKCKYCGHSIRQRYDDCLTNPPRMSPFTKFLRALLD
jgi:hypothetical protein